MFLSQAHLRYISKRERFNSILKKFTGKSEKSP